jgi:hypothetical protein
MSANLEHSPDLPARPAPGGDPSRRNLLIGLPAAVGTAAIVGGGWPAAPELQPVGEAAARLAVEVRTGAWSRATSFAEAMLKQCLRHALTSLLVSYAAIHEATIGTPASAVHMLAVSDVIMPPPRIGLQALWRAWRDGRQKGFDPAQFDAAKFDAAWVRGRLVELEQHDDLVSRLGSVAPVFG